MSESEFTFTDKRRIDPETFEVRGSEQTPTPEPEAVVGLGQSAAKADKPETKAAKTEENPGIDPNLEMLGEAEVLAAAEEVVNAAAENLSEVETREAQLEALVAERTEDLQRVQAEYQNYKRRVDRDRELSRKGGIEAVVLDLMPVLDAVEAAKAHGEIDAGFKLVIEELERIAAKYHLEFFGKVGEAFDPTLHEALLQMPYSEPVAVATVSQVMQPGVKLADRVLRPARVAVAEPEA